MTMEALPTYLNFPEDTSNLAAFPQQEPTLYRAWDGTPVGYGSGCDPISAMPQLSGWNSEEIVDLPFAAIYGAAVGAVVPHYLRQDTRLRGAVVGAVAGTVLMWVWNLLD